MKKWIHSVLAAADAILSEPGTRSGSQTDWRSSVPEAGVLWRDWRAMDMPAELSAEAARTVMGVNLGHLTSDSTGIAGRWLAGDSDPEDHDERVRLLDQLDLVIPHLANRERAYLAMAREVFRRLPTA